MKRNVFSILIILIVLFSCQKSKVDPIAAVVTPVAITASTLTNVAYGTDALQKMDVFLPANRTVTSTKVMIVIHGGGWSAGDKSDMSVYVDTLKNRLPGYAFFNVNYRLTSLANSIPFPAQELDIKAVTDFINSKRAEYLISDKFVLLGASAGAHLAMLQAYKNASPKIKAVVDLYGPTDMADMYTNPASTLVTNTSIAFVVTGNPFGTPALFPAIYSSSSPLNYVSLESPPTIIFHGGADSLVRPTQSTRLIAALAQKGVTRQYVLYPTENHAYQGASLIDTYNKAVSFLNLYVQ